MISGYISLRVETLTIGDLFRKPEEMREKKKKTKESFEIILYIRIVLHLFPALN